MLSYTRSGVLKRLIMYKDQSVCLAVKQDMPCRSRSVHSSVHLNCAASAASAASASSSSFNDYVNQCLLKMDSDVKNSGRILTKDYQRLFENIKQITPSSSQSLIAIRCCGMYMKEVPVSQRNVYLSELWDYLKNCNVALDVSHYNSLLGAYLSNNYDFDPEAILQEMKNNNIVPNRVTYQRFFHKYCQNGDINKAESILNIMKAEDIPVNEGIFNSLVLGHCVNGDFQEANETLATMKESGVEPSQDTYAALIVHKLSYLHAHQNASDSQLQAELNVILDEANQNELLFSNTDFLNMICDLKLPEQSVVYDELISKIKRNVTYNEVCISSIIDMINEHRLDLALKLYDTLVTPAGVNESHQMLANFFIKHMLIAKVDDDKVCSILAKFKDNSINKYAFNKAAEFAIKYRSLETCKFYLDQFLKNDDIPARPHFFWPLICKAQNKSELFEVIKYFNSYIEENHSVSTFLDYIMPSLPDFEMHLDQLVEMGYRRPFLVSLVLRKHIIANDFESIKNLWDNEDASCKAFVNVDIFFKALNFSVEEAENTFKIIHCLAEHNEQAVYYNLIKNLKQKSVPALYAKYIDLLIQHEIILPRHLTQLLESDNNLPAELKSKLVCLYTPKIVLKNEETRNNIKELCNMEENVDQVAIELEKQIENIGLDTVLQDHTLSRSIIYFYFYRQRNLKKCREFLEMTPNNFRMQPAIVLSIFQSDPSLGFEFLDKYESRMDLMSLRSAERSMSACIYLLNRCLQNDPTGQLFTKWFNNIRSYFNEVPEERLMNVKLKYLMEQNQMDEATALYLKIIRQFRFSSAILNLMDYYVKKEDSITLQKLTDEGIKALNSSVVLSNLAMAFLLNNREKQAKKIMETSGLNINQNLLFRLKDLVEKMGKLDVFEQFFQICKPNCVADRRVIYLSLLKAYIKQDNVDKALNVWTNIQEENLVPPMEFLKELGEFLISKNLKVPFEIPSATEMDVLGQMFTGNTNQDTFNSEFMKVLRTNNLYKLERLRNHSIENGITLSLNNECSYILALIKNKDIQKAFDLVFKMLQETRYPTPQVIRQLLDKLSKQGQWQSIEKLEQLLPATILQNSSFTDQKMLAYIAGKQSDEFILDKLQNAKAITSPVILNLIQTRPNIIDPLTQVVLNKVKQTGQMLPLNVIWTHHMLHKDFAKAKEVFNMDKGLKDNLLVNNIIDKINKQNDVELAEQLASFVKQTYLPPNILAKTHSAWVNALINNEQYEQAEDVVVNVASDVKSLNPTFVQKLGKCIEQYLQRKPKFEVDGTSDAQAVEQSN